uniref:Protein transport protein Sec61 subunit beta n=1 Tax=Opuntia streptacantha TaxID=393608 RepID=A0A7C8YHR0_OPUST
MMGRGSRGSSPNTRPSTATPRGSAAAAGMRRRMTSSAGASRSVDDIIGRGSMLRFYTDDAPGLKVSPTTVLVMSIAFIAFVISLHVFGKLHRSSPAVGV